MAYILALSLWVENSEYSSSHRHNHEEGSCGYESSDEVVTKKARIRGLFIGNIYGGLLAR